MSTKAAQTLTTTDRTLHVEVQLDENTFELNVSPRNGEAHLMRLTFTRGFARELRDFLAHADDAPTNFAELI